MRSPKFGDEHLLVSDVERSMASSQRALGLRVTQDRPGHWAFLSSLESHRELAPSGYDGLAPDNVNTLESTNRPHALAAALPAR